MYVQKGGELYGFCPGKATWDVAAVAMYRQLLVMAEMRTFPKAGGLDDQDDETIDDLSWFLPKYDMIKFMSKAELILGSDKTQALAGKSKGRRRK